MCVEIPGRTKHRLWTVPNYIAATRVKINKLIIYLSIIINTFASITTRYAYRFSISEIFISSECLVMNVWRSTGTSKVALDSNGLPTASKQRVIELSDVPSLVRYI